MPASAVASLTPAITGMSGTCFGASGEMEEDIAGPWSVRYADARHEAVVKLLIKRGDVEADSKDDSGQTPLPHATEGGHEAVVKLLQTWNKISSA